jgi:WXG100 family type VII secretion target
MEIMSGQITMSPGELQDKAKTYGQSSHQIDEILSRLETLQGDLRDQWKGLAFDRFDDQFEELKPKVKEFSNLMDQIEKQLTETAQAMADQDEALSRNFGLR